MEVCFCKYTQYLHDLWGTMLSQPASLTTMWVIDPVSANYVRGDKGLKIILFRSMGLIEALSGRLYSRGWGKKKGEIYFFWHQKIDLPDQLTGTNLIILLR